MSAESAARYQRQAERLPLGPGERAALFGVDRRTEQRWRDGTVIPGSVELLMAWMAEPEAEADRAGRARELQELAARGREAA